MLISPPNDSLDNIVTKSTNNTNINTLIGTPSEIKFTPEITLSYYHQDYDHQGNKKKTITFFKLDPVTI